MLNETDLLNKAASGNIKAFEELIIGYEKLIYNIAFRMFSNTEDAKDISQEVLIKVYKNIDKCKNIKYFKSWLCTVTNNACIDELRRRKGKEAISLDETLNNEEGAKVMQVASDEPTPLDVALNKEQSSEIQQALNKLSEDYKMLIILRDINGFTYNELAEITKSNLGTVKSRLSRARIALREILKQEQTTDGKRLNNRREV